ncbi:MAG TPA: NFACT family protein [Pyrinomonadaceae bacterium]|nr:NFACT family protein [Pyrinomonadaceae bacterium]
MDDQTIEAIVAEVAPALAGRSVGRVFQLSRVSVAVDFRPHDGRYLFVSVEPSQPRIHLIERRARELEKQSLTHSPFSLVLQKQLGGATLASMVKDEGDRVVRLAFEAADEIGNAYSRALVAQLTGRAANLLLLDERGYVIDALRPPRGDGQEVGHKYQPPPRTSPKTTSTAPLFERGNFATLSEAADDYYRGLEEARRYEARAAAARARLRKEIAQREKLRRHLNRDLESHGSADEHKRIGDLLLANIATAKRLGNKVTLTDYYAEGAPLAEVEVDENSTLQEEAARRFNRYSKARRAADEITKRLAGLEQELATLEARRAELEEAIGARDEAALESFTGEKQEDGTRGPKTRRQKAADNVPGARRYRSSDGYEILVGRAARDNDHLTFRVARPHDLWLHAADYPGSHVIVRNPTRADIPHRTIIEAAQLAALFSQARRDAKVDVHYTQRKFLSKPKGAAPGLVRMSSFRSITAEPREGVERI